MGTWTSIDQEAEAIIRGIYDAEYPKLVRCAASYLKIRNDALHVLNRAEDVVQETFALAWERREEVLSKENRVAWMYSTLQYKAKEILREENKWIKRLVQYEKFYHQPADPYDNLELRLELEGLVSKKDFDLLYKHYVGGYSYQELCQETGLTKSSLGVRVHRIKQKMQEQLKE